MRRSSFERLLGLTITAVGVIVLLLNLGFFGAAAALIWVLLFGAGGLALLAVVAQNRERWWALIPGTTLIGLGLVMALSAIAPAFAAAVSGTIFLGAIAVGFAAVYLVRPGFWWALIPAGALLTLAVLAGIGAQIAGPLAGMVLFGGLALTFGLVAIAPPDAPRRWALVPAGVLLAMAALSLAGNATAFNIMGPALLILSGLTLLYRALRHKDGRPYDDTPVPHAH